MNDTTVRARVDHDLKDETDKIFAELGISTTDAIRMFLSQVRLQRGLPFSVGLPDQNDDLLVPNSMRQSALDSVYDD
jgi:DNA-damage-inducible protein J